MMGEGLFQITLYHGYLLQILAAELIFTRPLPRRSRFWLRLPVGAAVYAALAVRDGLDELEGLKAVTLNPAQVLGIDDRKGDLKPGLDADIVVWDQHPFAYQAHVEQCFLGGKAMC